MDLAALLFAIGFEGALAAVAVLLVATFLSFLRMNPDVRRARMYIMANRVIRFLGGFTLGFVAIAVVVLFDLLSIPPPAVVSLAAIVVFLTAVLYGSVELFWIVRPRSSTRSARGLRARAVRERPADPPAAQASREGEGDAPR